MPGGLMGTGNRGGLMGVDDVGDGSVSTSDLANLAVTTAKIANNAVTDAKIRQSAGYSVIGRSASTTGNVADITAAADNTVLIRQSGSLSFTSLVLANITSVPGTGRIPFGHSDNTLTSSAELSYVTSTGVFDVAKSLVGTVTASARNTSNASTSAHARLTAEVGGTSGGDASVHLAISGGQSYTWKLANAVNDELQLECAGSVKARISTGGLWVVGADRQPSAGIMFSVGGDGNNAISRVECTAGGGNAQHYYASGTTEARTIAYGQSAGSTDNGETCAGLTILKVVTGELLALAIAGDKTIGLTVNGVRRVTVNSTGVTFANRARWAKGADVASGGTLTLGSDGNSFDITGTTAIDYITTTNWTAGSIVVLQFDASVSVNHNSGSVPADTAAIHLAGAANLSATAGDTLTLWYDGTVWREIARTVI